MPDYLRYFHTVETKKKVKKITVQLEVTDCTGTVRMADIQLQEGSVLTGWACHTQEMLKRETRADGTPIITRHTNVVIRGKKTINVPNRASISEEIGLEKRVTGGMGFKFEATSAVPNSGLKFSHEYETKTFVLHEPLNPSDVFDFYPSTRTVAINGRNTSNYTGFYHTCPGGMGRFNVEATTGLLLCEPDAWLKGIGGERM